VSGVARIDDVTAEAARSKSRRVDGAARFQQRNRWPTAGWSAAGVEARAWLMAIRIAPFPHPHERVVVCVVAG
jgi:hypothetical protein